MKTPPHDELLTSASVAEVFLFISFHRTDITFNTCMRFTAIFQLNLDNFQMKNHKILLILTLKHRIRVLVRTASLMLF